MGAAFPLVDLGLLRSGTAEVIGGSFLTFGGDRLGGGIKGSLEGRSMGWCFGSDVAGGFVTDFVVLCNVGFTAGAGIFGCCSL